MRAVTLAVLVLTVGVLASASVLIAYSLQDAVFFYEHKAAMPYRFEVAERSGIDVQDDRLRLGAVAPGTVNRRNITIYGNSSERVLIRVKGDGKDILHPAHSELSLTDGSASVEFRVAPDSGTGFGVYEGEVVFYFLSR